MADQISYEELQKAAQSIVQCAANVYTVRIDDGNDLNRFRLFLS